MLNYSGTTLHYYKHGSNHRSRGTACSRRLHTFAFFFSSASSWNLASSRLLVSPALTVIQLLTSCAAVSVAACRKLRTVELQENKAAQQQVELASVSMTAQ
jgi:hypothetical protein